MASYRLHYFDVRGRAEIVRMLFKLAQVEFEDIRVTESEWPRVKLGKFVDFFLLINKLVYFMYKLSTRDSSNCIRLKQVHRWRKKGIYVPQVETQLNLNSTHF